MLMMWDKTNKLMKNLPIHLVRYNIAYLKKYKKNKNLFYNEVFFGFLNKKNNK